MKYQARILSDIRKRNKKDFLKTIGFTVIPCGLVLVISVFQMPQYVAFAASMMLAVVVFLIAIFGVIYFSDITYKELKNESSHFDEDKIKMIDADYNTAVILPRYTRVGTSYVYGYKKDTFVIVPIQQIDSIFEEIWLGANWGHMIIMIKRNGARCVIGPFNNKEESMQIIHQIMRQNQNIKGK